MRVNAMHFAEMSYVKNQWLSSKSSMGNHVWVQVPPPVLLKRKGLATNGRKSFFVLPWSAIAAVSPEANRCLTRGGAYASHDDRDVVPASEPIGFRNQAFARSLRIVLLFKNGGNLFFGNHLREAVGAKQQRIVGMEIEAVQFDLNSRLRAAEDIRHDMPPPMPGHLAPLKSCHDGPFQRASYDPGSTAAASRSNRGSNDYRRRGPRTVAS